MPTARQILTVPLNGRPACHYCDECQRGCFTASYFNSPSVTLPAAATTGRFQLVSDAVVSHLLMNAEGKPMAWHFIDRTTRAAREVRGKVVVLAASALESTRILLNSRSRRFPNGVGNANGVLGHYLMDHTTLENGGGVMPALKSSKREPVGRPLRLHHPEVRQHGRKIQNKNFLRGYYFAGDGQPGTVRARVVHSRDSARKWREKVRDNIPYAFSLYAQGECLPRYDNYVELDPEKKDAWGIPALHIHASYGENEHAMAKAMRKHLGEMMDELKLKIARPRDELNIFGKNIHECGTARMGDDPKTSVLNAYNQVHDVKNVFVTDGAALSRKAARSRRSPSWRFRSARRITSRMNSERGICDGRNLATPLADAHGRRHGAGGMEWSI